MKPLEKYVFSVIYLRYILFNRRTFKDNGLLSPVPLAGSILAR